MTHATADPVAPSLPGRLLLLAYALGAYVVFLGVFVGFILWSIAAVPPWTVDAGPLMFAVASPVGAVAVDLGLVALFGLQHSLMARQRFKAMLARLLPRPAERYRRERVPMLFPRPGASIERIE